MTRKNKISLPEPDLIQEMLKKSKLGSEALYDMYSSSLFGVICRLVPEQELAEDLLQETFVKIWNSFDSYDSTKGRLFTWMVNIARNLSVDKLRSKNYRNNSKTDTIENSVSLVESQFTTSWNPELLGVKDLTQNLKPELKAVLDLVYFKGYTQTEAAEELGIPLGTVKTRVRNAIIVLRKVFN